MFIGSILGSVIITGIVVLILMIAYRKVVPASEVHIVNAKNEARTYGNTENSLGNVYYGWPASWPFFGVSVKIMPSSVFAIDIEDYKAYDIERVPFLVDVKAFFRIDDFKLASTRIESRESIHSQLEGIVQGSIRSILADNDIHEIMRGRSKFGDAFTEAVSGDLKNWGISSVKSMELMDIRDADDSKVIHNIMEKKKSEIEKDSRIAVATNNKLAESSEIEAKQEVEIKRQASEQMIGIRTSEKDRAVGIAAEQSKQAVSESALITVEKQVAVDKASDIGKAEIAKQVALVNESQQKEVAKIVAETAVIKATQAKDVAIVDAETAVVKAKQEKEVQVVAAQATLESTKMDAEGVQVKGEAEAAAEKAKLMAPVDAQIRLSEAISSNPAYMNYLISAEGVKAFEHVGMKQAEALGNADLKVIANAGEVKTGVNSIMDLFSSKGGTNLTAMLEGLAQGEQGQALLEKFGIKLNNEAGTAAPAKEVKGEQADQ